MTIAIELTPNNDLQLSLACAADHGFLPAEAVFVGESYIAIYAAAMKAGWKETYIKDAREFLCPECSGKVPR